MRPEVIIPREDITAQEAKNREKKKSSVGLAIGSQIRVIRAPYFGRIGKVVGLPPELQKLDSESKARVLELQFDDTGEKVVVPRANVELVEE